MKTAQEKAWDGDFGAAYHDRAPGNEEANFHLFRNILYRLPGRSRVIIPKTLLEVGAGTGANIRALARLYPDALITALEINAQAAARIKADTPKALVIESSLFEWLPQTVTYDLVLTKGLLIHIPPEQLTTAYERIYEAAARWILLVEYYNPTPVMIPYRGEQDRLWKRDFAGEMLDRFSDLNLMDYGFVYHRDVHPQDDVTWMLLEKMA